MIEQFITALSVFAGAVAGGILTFEYGQWRLRKTLTPTLKRLETFFKKMGVE